MARGLSLTFINPRIGVDDTQLFYPEPCFKNLEAGSPQLFLARGSFLAHLHLSRGFDFEAVTLATSIQDFGPSIQTTTKLCPALAGAVKVELDPLQHLLGSKEPAAKRINQPVCSMADGRNP